MSCWKPNTQRNFPLKPSRFLLYTLNKHTRSEPKRKQNLKCRNSYVNIHTTKPHKQPTNKLPFQVLMWKALLKPQKYWSIVAWRRSFLFCSPFFPIHRTHKIEFRWKRTYDIIIIEHQEHGKSLFMHEPSQYRRIRKFVALFLSPRKANKDQNRRKKSPPFVTVAFHYGLKLFETNAIIIHILFSLLLYPLKAHFTFGFFFFFGETGGLLFIEMYKRFVFH